MSVNYLCIINRTENPSWIDVTRLRMEQENNKMPRFDEIRVYLPDIIGICRARFAHELNSYEKSSLDKKNSDYRIIQYQGMDSEHEHEESRAILYKKWVIWNENTQTFSKNLNFGHGNYFFIKFPQSYIEGLE